MLKQLNLLKKIWIGGLDWLILTKWGTKLTKIKFWGLIGNWSKSQETNLSFIIFFNIKISNSILDIFLKTMVVINLLFIFKTLNKHKIYLEMKIYIYILYQSCPNFSKIMLLLYPVLSCLVCVRVSVSQCPCTCFLDSNLDSLIY